MYVKTIAYLLISTHMYTTHPHTRTHTRTHLRTHITNGSQREEVGRTERGENLQENADVIDDVRREPPALGV